MKKVFKYTLAFTDYVELELPVGAKILHFDIQHGDPRIWALVDPTHTVEREIRKFRLAGTGHPITELDSELKFIGTVMMQGGTLVWHLFEVIKVIT